MSFRMVHKKELRRFVKFCIVGGSGVIVNEGLLWLLHDMAGFFLYPSSIIAIEASIWNNFTWHELWTFRDRRQGTAWKRIGKFHVVSAGAMILNMATLALLTEVFDINHLIANIVGIAFAFTCRFFVDTSWTWGKGGPNNT
ncbi:MAG: GtrA family protein [Chloroflexi bacterium]|nr:GtrA family protein [Chloroflexota bacterium]